MTKILLSTLLVLATACTSHIPEGYCDPNDVSCVADGGTFQCFECADHEMCDETTAYECVPDPESQWQITIYAVGFTGFTTPPLSWDPGTLPESAPDVASRIILSGDATNERRDYFYARVQLHTVNSQSFTEVIGASPIVVPYRDHASYEELDGAMWSFFDDDGAGGLEDIASCTINLDQVTLGGARNYLDCVHPVTGESVRVAWAVTKAVIVP